VAIEYKLEEIGEIKACIDFRILQVKVPIILFWYAGISGTQDGHYTQFFFGY
jgi:hypothetical protein